MATTNSSDKKLNHFYSSSDENSGVEDLEIVNTGNKETKIGQHVLNDTYTLKSSGKVQEVNAKLLGFNDIVSVAGSDIIDSFSGQNVSDASIIKADETYTIIGQPNKWVYDYQQAYSDCGIDAVLNVLSMAGKKDIVEITEEYAQYLSTPQETTKKDVVWDSGANEWKVEEKTVSKMPKAPVETEDELLLWAVQNSKNDELWYQKGYTPDKNPYAYFNDPDSYCLHKDNYDEYHKIEDLKEYPTQVGSTFYWQQENLLNKMGVKSLAGLYEFKSMIKEKDPAVEEKSCEYKYEKTGKQDENGRDIYKRTKTLTTETMNETHSKVTTTITVTEEEVIKGEQEGSDTVVSTQPLDVKTVVTEKNVLNQYLYDFAQQFEKWIGDGRGLIVGGEANGFTGGSGGSHCITIVGVVRGDVLETTQTVTHTSYDDYGNENTDNSGFEINGASYGNEEQKSNDIIGFYVVDTGGFLGSIEGAQFVSVERLYDFITGSYYADSADSKKSMYGQLVVTESNIKSWADNLNLTGNKAKNVLYGNYADNTIKAGSGNDVLYGQDGRDKLYGENNNDTIMGGLGDDTLYGGSGNDTYIFKKSDIQTVAPNIDPLVYTEQPIGGEGEDKTTVKVFEMDKTEEASDGTDYRYGSEIKEVYDKSNDIIIPGSGKDSIQFDDILSESNDAPRTELTYSNKNGSLVIQTKYNGSVTIQDYFKKSLYDNIQYLIKGTTNKTTGGYVDITKYAFVKEILEKVAISYADTVVKDKANKITGTKFMDSIVGGDYNDTLSGGSGNDTLNGGKGSDILKGGSGNDVIFASEGNDKIYGESGTNIIKYEDISLGGSDTIYSGTGKDVIELKTINKGDVTMAKSGNSLVIYYNKTGGSITIADYFKKKGKVSVDHIEFKDGNINVRNSLSEINAIVFPHASRKIKGNGLIEGDDGYDTLTGGNYSDTLIGGKGDDILKGGKGDDILNGGLGNDKLYGESGNNIYRYEDRIFGSDTIYTSGKGQTIIDFSSTNLTFTNKGEVGSFDNGYSYTKSGNNLVINYAERAGDTVNSKITIKDFFKSKNSFTLKQKNGSDLNLKEAVIYFKGAENKKNTLYGSSINDYMAGGKLNDNIKGSSGNDTMSGGLGNDTITGGTGHNTYEYKKGDGNDVIVLSKGEKLDLKLSGFKDKSDLSYRVSGKNLVISYLNENGTTSTITVKNFGTSDVTTSSGSVDLYVNGTKAYDLRTDKFLADYTAFTQNKRSYTGTWHSEVIDARALNAKDVVISRSKGASINAGTGNDTIYGSDYNDTIKGGNGDDFIYAGLGKNTLDGGSGSDTYCLFNNKSGTQYSVESTTVKDTGKSGADTAEFYRSKDKLQVWFNVSRNGKVSGGINIEDTETGDEATLTGIEKFIANNATADNKNDDYLYNYDAVRQQVASWLAGNGYKDVNYAMKHADNEKIEYLMALFNNSSNAWQKV